MTLDQHLDEAEKMLRAFGVEDEANAVAEAREAIKANLTPGFICEACGVFTGDGKEHQTHCRCCGKERP
jgi:hypothetical protein